MRLCKFKSDGGICCKLSISYVCPHIKTHYDVPDISNYIIASLVFILGILIQFSSFYNYPLASKSAIMAIKPLSEIFAERAVELRKYIFDQPASTFTNNPWALADAIEVFANQVGHMMIFRKSKFAVAREQLLAQQPAPRTIVEFGTFVGKSALAWAAILRDLHGENVPKDVNIYTFDPDAQMVALTLEFVKLAGVEDFVHVLQGPGSDSLKKLHAEGKLTTIDMAFFDHWEKFYVSDLKLIEELKLWRVGSLAIADNTDFPGAPDYLDYVKAGGSGVSGSVKYETKSFETSGKRGGPVSFVSKKFGLGLRLMNHSRASSR